MTNYNPKTDDFTRLLGEVESAAGYVFKERSLLLEAVTHSSYLLENSRYTVCNERLEFLGDAVLELEVSRRLFAEELNAAEGELTVARALLVDEEANAQHAVQLGLDKVLLLSRGENLTGGRQRRSILGDLYEAFLGAVYSDGGMDAAAGVIARVLPEISVWRQRARLANAKGELQEYCQGQLQCRPAYVNERREGAVHQPRFEVDVEVNGEIVGSGSGATKKEAQQHAAAQALENLRRRNEASAE